MKKRIVAIALVLALFVCAVPASALTYLYIATGGSQGTYHSLGGEFARLINNRINLVIASAHRTGGSDENINLINLDEMDLALVQNDAANRAFLDEGGYNFSILGNLYPEVVQVVSRKEDGLETVADLSGKRISIGAEGSGVNQNAYDFLEGAGLSADDIEVHMLSFAESMRALDENEIDAAFVTAGIANPGIYELAQKRELVLMSLTDTVLDAITAEHPYYQRFVIPEGTYQGQDAPAVSLNVSALLIAQNNVTEAMAYQVTKLIYERAAELTHEKRSDIRIDNALNGFDFVHLHPGAAKFYKELGIIE